MFTFTRQEKVFLLIISAIVLIGSGINYVFLMHPGLKDRLAFIETAHIPGRIDINTACLKDLIKIPYVGEKRARQILDYRAAKGGFQTVEQLQEIYGIGPKTFRKMAPYVWVTPTQGK